MSVGADELVENKTMRCFEVDQALDSSLRIGEARVTDKAIILCRLLSSDSGSSSLTFSGNEPERDAKIICLLQSAPGCLEGMQTTLGSDRRRKRICT